MSNRFSLNELDAILQIIAAASKKGAFEGPDLPTVGAVWQRVVEVSKATAELEAAALKAAEEAEAKNKPKG
ncbi:hypothetical protein [Sphingobium sp. LSP13-1-1.1]|uniref:hypothetical protein n=1 Tax=Sphingobium sp. LSP13-1-1.1 TaxID=3135234 RepID=UPI00342868CC